MSAKNLSLVLLAALALGGAAIALNMFGGDPSGDAQAVEWVDDEDETGPAGTLTAEGEAKRELARAQASEGSPAAPEEDEDEPRPRIEVSGRVVGDNGTPVAGAKVSLHYRMSFDALRNRGDFGGGFGGGPGGPGGGPGGDRRFRQRAAGKPVLTDTEGRFSFAGQVYQTSNLELHVVHEEFAPAVVQRDWSSREGLLDIGDVVVGAGVTVSGFVVDTDNRPIAGAEVRFQSQANGGGGMGGRGRGMGGRGGQRDGETNTEARLEDLIAQAKSDPTGFFRIEHVPAGRFRLMARATKYLPGLSPAIEGKSGEQADAGKLQLTLGVELRGVVLDAQGKPVADARVEAGASFRRGGRDGGTGGAPADAAPAAAAAPAENRAPDWEAIAMRMGNNRRTRTNERGEFALDSLPPGELRLRVEHPRFVTEERQPIDAAKEPRVTVRLEAALMITGRVLDDTTGEPIGTFAIAARETDGGGGRGGNDPAQGRGRRGGQDAGNGGGRGRRGGETTDEVAPEVAAARAADEARRAQRESYLQQRLGPTGQAPRNPGRPKAWAGGQFTLPGQQPGRFVIDVMADDYIGVVAGPIELVKGQMPEPLTIRLRRGSKITGRVEDRVTREPLANVDVSLLLPIEDQPVANEAEQPWAMFRPREVGRRITRTRTDAAGRFTLRPQTSGEYWVRLDHDGYNQLLDRNVFVTDGRDLETPAYPLVPGSEVSGRILNPTADKHYTVTLFAAGGQRRSARVQKDLTYRIDGIDPGSYWVLLNDGSNNDGGGGGGRRGMPGGVMSRLSDMARGNTQPDLVIGEGIKLRHDIDAGARAPGSVRGRVALNGLGAAGYDVSLSSPPTEAEAANQQGGGRRGGGMRGMMNRLLSEQTDADGKFTLEGVPAGSYILEVRRGGGGGGGGRGGRGGRGGGGGGATLHREPIVVTQGGIVERNLVFSTGAVAFEVASEADDKPVDRANIEMVLASEASGTAPEQWRSLASFTNAMVRNGTASLTDIKTGDWSYRIQAQGQAPVQGTAFVQQTTTPTPIRLKLKPAAPPK